MADLIGALVPILAAMLVTLAAICLLAFADWRISTFFLCLLYLGVLLLTAASWPLALSMTRLVAGWMAAAIVGMAAASGKTETGPSSSHVSPLFTLFAALLAGAAGLSQVPQLETTFPGISLAQSWGAAMLVCLGVVKIGLSGEPFPIITGLLTTLAGFGVIVPVLNAAPLTAGLLAAIDLGLALAGAYLMLAPAMESSA